MSSISPDDSLQQVRRFFLGEMMPLAKKLQDAGKAFFPVKADANARTYYIKRDKTTMEPASFEEPGCDSPDAFEKALTDMWTSQGCAELNVLAPALAKLAKSLYSVEEQKEEVSPFIYVMF